MFFKCQVLRIQYNLAQYNLAMGHKNFANSNVTLNLFLYVEI